MTRHTLSLVALLTLACTNGDTDTTDDTDDTDVGDTDSVEPGVPTTYTFTDPNGDSTVSYSGQVFRNLLISDMKIAIAEVQTQLEGGSFFPADGEVEAELGFFFDFTLEGFDAAALGQLPILTSTSPAATQMVWDDVSTDKNLVGKIAGNDAVGQHEDWSTALIGGGANSPEELVRSWLAELDDAAVAWSNGNAALDPSGAPVPAFHVTADGRDLQQLLEKFLRGAVAYSQGADDYLDDDEPGKGLLSDNAAPDGTSAYTPLAHQWDEGFGYFGAARTYGDWTVDQIADTTAWDVDGDGAVDFTSEACMGASVNAAKRDRGGAANTDFVGDAWTAFLAGRALIENTEGALSDEQLDELRGYRDDALLAWDNALASTAVHYINDTLQDMGAIGSDDYSFGDHAKHWSELKGFALSLQFSPHAQISDTDLQTLHDLIGDAPVVADAPQAERDAYADDLIAARALLGTAYGYTAEQLGDDDGLNGW